MERENLRALLRSVQEGETDPDEALSALSGPAFIDTPNARVDLQRAVRHGIPEVIFAPGKTPAQVVEVAKALREAGQSVLATRLSPEQVDALEAAFDDVGHDALARLAWLGPEPVRQGKGTIAVVAAGTSDLPVAREALGVAERFGNDVSLLADVGVAGIHRLLASSDTLVAARVVIAVAGMEGALPSVVGGLVDKPVIAVPTSVGYGAAFGGLAALLGMLTSCASNVTVVNIDNGFGAAYVATLINRLP